jgi:hypothetical protein
MEINLVMEQLTVKINNIISGIRDQKSSGIILESLESECKIEKKDKSKDKN